MAIYGRKKAAKGHRYKVVDSEGYVIRFCRSYIEAREYAGVRKGWEVMMTDSYKAKTKRQEVGV